MTKWIIAAALLIGASAALARNPPGPPDPNRGKANPALYEKCHALAKERGWLSGGYAKAHHQEAGQVHWGPHAREAKLVPGIRAE